MLIKELLEILDQYDKSLEIYIWCSDCDEAKVVDEVYFEKHSNRVGIAV